MIREGEPEVTLKFLAQHPNRKLAINHFTEGTSPEHRYGLQWLAGRSAGLAGGSLTCGQWTAQAGESIRM